MSLVPQDWPQVPAPEFGKRKLFVAENLLQDDLEYLGKLGWQVVDVRLMSQADRKSAVEAKLEGISMGSIQATKQQLEALELEMRVLKMLLQKESGMPRDGAGTIPQDALEALGSIGSSRSGLDLEAMHKKLTESKRKRTKA